MSRGELKKVSALFARYQERLVAPEGSVISAFVEVVEDLWGIVLTRSQVRYSPASRILSLVGSSTLRQEIKRQEKEILDHLRGRLGDKGSPKSIL